MDERMNGGGSAERRHVPLWTCDYYVKMLGYKRGCTLVGYRHKRGIFPFASMRIQVFYRHPSIDSTKMINSLSYELTH